MVAIFAAAWLYRQFLTLFTQAVRSDWRTGQMTSTSNAISELARRLIAVEVAKSDGPGTSGSEAARVCERLRLSLGKFAGVAGYHSLISRAVAMAKAEAPSFDSLRVQSDGSLEGFHDVEQKDSEAGTVVVVHVLSLLVTFIGKPLTTSLIRAAWPEASLTEDGLQKEEQS